MKPGFCHCGCGRKTTIATRNRTDKGWVKGQPLPYLPSHGGRIHGGTWSGAWRSWMAMRQRCLDPNRPMRQRYSARGIRICKRWEKFENFLADMGERPKGKSLDRFPDPAGNYTPRNCRWATPGQQAHNRRDNKLTLSLVRAIRRSKQKSKDLAKRYGVSPPTISMIRSGKRWT